MSDDKFDKESKPLLYVDQVEVKVQNKNMQSDYRTKKRKNERTQEETSPVEDSRKEQKVEQIKQEFGVYDAMREIESELSEIKKIKNQYATEQPPPVAPPEYHEQEEKKKVKKKRKVETKETTRDIITRLSNHKGYPKPICEAVIQGETLQFQVMGMRRESVKIKRGNRIRFVSLSDIINAKIIDDSNK